MLLSIVIVNYNVCYFLEQTLKSVFNALKNIEAEVFVVDNASVDGSVEMVRAKFPQVQLIANTENVGFSKANNQAIRTSRGKYVLLLNPDTVVQEDTFTKCCQYMETHPDAGGLGVYMVDGKGHFLPESKRGLPTPWVAFYKICGLSKLFPNSKKFGRYHLGFIDKNKTSEIDVLSGAFMLMRKAALDKVGLLDEDYFMYGEDIDLSYRIQKGGYQNIYFPETRIIHYKGESTKKSSVNYVLVFYGAMIIFAKKHFKGAYAGAFITLIRLAIYARAAFSILKRMVQLLYLPSLQFAIVFAGMVFITNFWEENIKDNSNFYPPLFIYVTIPLYIVTWLVCNYYNGGYDKPFKAYRVVRGIFIGTLVISSVSNFLDSYRFSKAIILMGSVWAAMSIITLHYLLKFIKYKKIEIEEHSDKKVIVVGNHEESTRVFNLIKNTGMKANIFGFVSTDNVSSAFDMYLGSVDRLQEIAKIYKPDEIIFCSKNIAAGDIIEMMASIGNQNIEFKIVPDESNFIIGSSNKDTAGELYTLDVHLALLDRHNIRNKRVIDFTLSVMFIIMSPILIFYIKSPWKMIENMFKVAIGKKSLVGFCGNGDERLPKIKKGILSPASEFEQITLNDETIHRLNLIYAKDYHTSTDLNIVFANIQKLGNSNV